MLPYFWLSRTVKWAYKYDWNIWWRLIKAVILVNSQIWKTEFILNVTGAMKGVFHLSSLEFVWTEMKYFSNGNDMMTAFSLSIYAFLCMFQYHELVVAETEAHKLSIIKIQLKSSDRM